MLEPWGDGGYLASYFWQAGDWSAGRWLGDTITINGDVPQAPLIVAVDDWSRVPSAPYLPWTPGWRGFDNPAPRAAALGLFHAPPTLCATDRGDGTGTHTDTLRVIFTVTAASGQPDATYYYKAENAPYEGVVTLPTNGPVAELLEFATHVIALDNSMSVWATNPDFNGNQLLPTAVTGPGVDLFGASPVATGVLRGDRVFAFADNPARLAIVQLTVPASLPGNLGVTALRDGTATGDELAGVAGMVVDFTVVWDLAWVLSNDSGTYHLYRFRFTDSSSDPPVLEYQATLAEAGQPVAIGIRFSDDTHDEGIAVAVVRRGVGVELRGEDLSFLSFTPLPGDAQDFIWGSWVLLGDFGAAQLQGPNAAPTPSYVRSNTWNPGRAIHGSGRIATPTGPAW